MTRNRGWILLLTITAVTIGCSKSGTPTGPATPQVYTTFYPTTYFTARIAAGAVEIVCPIPPDEDPIFWMPDVATVSAYQKADLIVINGAYFEKWVEKVSLPAAKLVDTALPFESRYLRFTGAVTHSHGAGGEHSHEGVDGHTWLDPNLAKIQADQIHRALARLLPDQAGEFRGNLTALANDLDKLHEAFENLSNAMKGAPLLASHPAYNYLAKRYAWDVTNLDLDPEQMPTDEAMADIRAKLADKPTRIILWEAPPLPEIAERFEKELRLTSVVFSPCELLTEDQRKAEHDYMKVMHDNIDRLRAALGD